MLSRWHALRAHPCRQALVLAFLVAVFVGHAALYWSWVEDDAYITLRYADNLVAGHGPVFNPGERVEGYSNPAWMLLGALALRLGLDPLVAWRALGLLAGVGCLVISWRLARRLAPDAGAWALLAPAWLALTPLLPRHAVSGLETVAQALVLSLGFMVLVWPAERRSWWLPLAAMLALILMRPEGAGFAALLLALRGRRGPAWWRWWALLGVLVVAFTIWRWGYYDALLPNTFHVKMTGEQQSWRAGFHHLREFLRDGGGAALLALSAVLLACRLAAAAARGVLIVVAAQAALLIAAGGDWMHHHRFMVPIMPLLTATMAAGGGVLVRTLTEAWGRPRIPTVVVATLVVVGLSGNYLAERAIWQEVMPAVRAGQYLPQSYGRVASWLRQHTSPHALVAISDIGAVGYHSRRRILDMIGLVDRHVARTPGGLHAKHDPQYVLSRAPDYVVLVETPGGEGPPTYWRAADRALAEARGFVEAYHAVATIPLGYRRELARIYARRDAIADLDGETGP